MSTNEGEVTNGHGQIFGLMSQILQDVESIGKGRSNEQQGYKFRGIDDVYNMVHPLMSKHQVFCVPRMLAQDTSERVTASGTTLRFVQLSMAYDFFAPDGSHVTAEVMGEAMDAGDKASNKAMSAAHKYALLQTFCIPTGDVPDADYTTHPEVTGERKQVSRSSTASQNCPKCGGPCWDNREGKRNPKAPDYKCKNKSCDGAIWLKDAEPLTEGFSDDQVLRDQLFKQAEILMAGVPADKRKDALGRLLMLNTAQMAEKVNELAENARKKQPTPSQELERDIQIREIKRDATAPMIEAYLADHGFTSMDAMDTRAIAEMHENLVVPF